MVLHTIINEYDVLYGYQNCKSEDFFTTDPYRYLDIQSYNKLNHIRRRQDEHIRSNITSDYTRFY